MFCNPVDYCELLIAAILNNNIPDQNSNTSNHENVPLTFHVAYITYKFRESVDIHVLVLLVLLMHCSPSFLQSWQSFLVKMDHIFIVSLLFVACTSLTGAIIPKYSIAYFKQKLDHFNFVQDATFSQRYLYTGTVSNLNMTLR